MQDPLISIIVPIYKVEPYLRCCLDSIVNQSYTNLEIILVDDGSPDECPQICDEYAAKDKRIIVIHKENGGLSDARNAGLDICRGEYVSFVDSDDWIDVKFVEILVTYIQKENSDIAIGKFEKKYEKDLNDKTTQKVNTPSMEILSNKQAIKNLFSKDGVCFGTAWCKLYTRTLFNNIRFPIGMLHEDDYTLYKILYGSKKIILLNVPLYFYLQRSDSIMGSAKPCSIRALRAKVERYFFFKANNELDLQAICLKNICWELLFAYSQKELKEEIVGFANSKEVLHYFYLCQQDHWKSRASFFEKIILKFFSIFPSFYKIYQKFSPVKIRKI